MIETSSSIFELVREKALEGGWSDAQLAEIVGYVARSAILSRRLAVFEATRGRIDFDKEDRNYFWDNDGVPTFYLSPRYKNQPDGSGANVSVITQIIAHELSHFETYFPTGVGTTLSRQPDENAAGAAGVRDEARAYALEYFIQREINATEVGVDWLLEEQEAGCRTALAALPAGAGEIEQLDAATLAILNWAANWTDEESKGGYFQYYQNYWLTVQETRRSVASREVDLRCNADGNIFEVTFRDVEQDRRRRAVIDPVIGRFVPRRT